MVMVVVVVADDEETYRMFDLAVCCVFENQI
jgi:hypothetical protein